MPSHTLSIVCAALTLGFALGCTVSMEDTDVAFWDVSQLRVTTDWTHRVYVHGRVSSEDDPFQEGTTMELRFYRDAYVTLIETTWEEVGVDDAEFEVTGITTRLAPETDGETQVCVAIRVDNSNREEWFEAGCVFGS